MKNKTLDNILIIALATAVTIEVLAQMGNEYIIINVISFLIAMLSELYLLLIAIMIGISVMIMADIVKRITEVEQSKKKRKQMQKVTRPKTDMRKAVNIQVEREYTIDGNRYVEKESGETVKAKQ